MHGSAASCLVLQLFAGAAEPRHTALVELQLVCSGSCSPCLSSAAGFCLLEPELLQVEILLPNCIQDNMERRNLILLGCVGASCPRSESCAAAAVKSVRSGRSAGSVGAAGLCLSSFVGFSILHFPHDSDVSPDACNRDSTKEEFRASEQSCIMQQQMVKVNVSFCWI